MRKMKHLRNKNSIPTELSWEEKNPRSYIYRPSQAVIRLRSANAGRDVCHSRSSP